MTRSKESTTVSNEIARRPAAPAATTDPVQLGATLAQSGYFADARQAAQAAVKVMAGQEIGLPPVASMTGVYIVQGRVTIGANLMAALMRKHPDYDYRVTEHTDEACTVVVFYKGEEAGTSRFTLDDAKRAGLVKSGGPWVQHPRNMVFARAISNAAKWYAPDVFAGNPIYTPDELGAIVDGETGEVVQLPPQDASGAGTPPPPPPAPPAAADDDAESGEVIEDDDDFDPHTVIELLKAEFGAEVVKAASEAEQVKRYADLTRDNEPQLRERCKQIAMDELSGAAA